MLILLLQLVSGDRNPAPFHLPWMETILIPKKPRDILRGVVDAEQLFKD